MSVAKRARSEALPATAGRTWKVLVADDELQRRLPPWQAKAINGEP